MKRVLVHIDNLVLKGIRHGDRRDIAAGLQEELRRLFADPLGTHQRLAASADLSSLQVGNIRIAPGSPSRSVGVQAARRIAKGIRS